MEGNDEWETDDISADVAKLEKVQQRRAWEALNVVPAGDEKYRMSLALGCYGDAILDRAELLWELHREAY